MSATTVAERLADAGLNLPEAPKALGDYVPARRAGNLVFTSGQLPLTNGALEATGLVGVEVDTDTAARCARVALLNALAAASTVCDLEDVAGVVKLTGYVACAPEFGSQPLVLNAASACLISAFGENGAHAREAIGVAALPMNSPVELSLVLELR